MKNRCGWNARELNTRMYTRPIRRMRPIRYPNTFVFLSVCRARTNSNISPMLTIGSQYVGIRDVIVSPDMNSRYTNTGTTQNAETASVAAMCLMTGISTRLLSVETNTLPMSIRIAASPV